MTKFVRIEKRDVQDIGECDFYHSMDLPGYKSVEGQWDLRGEENTYLGGVDLQGKSVLEIGPASGHLSFWMESQGANVTVFDLSEDHEWDFVPYHNLDRTSLAAERKRHLRRLQNSWWLAHNALKMKSSAIYSTVYDIDSSLGSFDIVTLNCVLLHLRNPFLALEKASLVAKDTIIVTEVAEEQFFGEDPSMWNKLTMSFMPRAEARTPVDAWYFLPSITVAEMLKILGFSEIIITKHKQKFVSGPWQLYTIVANRPRG